MGEPLSIVGLIVAIPAVVDMLMTYYGDTKDAKADIQRCATDLFSLKGILEYIESVRDRQSGVGHKYDVADFEVLVGATQETLQDLQVMLEPKRSALGQLIQRGTWKMKKKEVQARFTRLERLKGGFMIVMTGDGLNQNETILSEISQLRLDARDDRQSRESRVMNQEREILLRWLDPVNPELAHAAASAAHQLGTGTWFTQGPLQIFQDYPHDESVVLWLQGKSGSGKTTLLAHTVEHLRSKCSDHDSSAFLYFYCSFSCLASQKAANILSSLLVQLCEGHPDLYSELHAKFMVSASKQMVLNLNLGELKDIFKRHTAALDRVYIFADALNESEEMDNVRDLLFSLAGFSNNIRILITCTCVANKSSLQDGFHLIESSMSTVDIDQDILKFIQERIVSSKALNGLSKSLQEEIEDAILEHANGVFRYAESQIAQVAAQLTGRDVRKVLSMMPHDLNETYERILRQLSSNLTHQMYAQRALVWLCFATRPLYLAELCEAVVVEHDDMDLDSDSRLQNLGTLVSLGHGLFDYDQETGLVTLSHSSVKTYLTSDYIRRSDVAQFGTSELEAHDMIMQTCLTYLRFKPFGIGCANSPQWSLPWPMRYPLLPYAALNWPLHIRSAGDNEWHNVYNFFSTIQMPYSGQYGFWVRWIAGPFDPSIVGKTSPLYYAASFGYAPLIRLLLRNLGTRDLEKPGGRNGSTALQVACFRCQREAVRVLLEAGANPCSPDGSMIDGGFSSLFWAKENGWDDIVELMIQKANAKGLEFCTKYNGKYAQELARQVQDSALKYMEAKKVGAEGAAWTHLHHPAPTTRFAPIEDMQAPKSSIRVSSIQNVQASKKPVEAIRIGERLL